MTRRLSRTPLLPLALLSLAACGSPPAAPAASPASPAHDAAAPKPATAAAPAPADPLGAKIDPLFARYAKPGVPGCALGVYRAGELVFARGYGEASLEHGLPIDAHTVFDVGSISKQFTAAAILLLAQDGKLSLDDDVRKYIPELPDFGRPIRIQHLLHHTSGLRDYAGLLMIDGFDDADLTDDQDALFVIEHQKKLNFPTGTAWSYSNTGYFLASILVKRVSGTTLAEFAKKRIFEPLGMTSTFYFDDHTRVVHDRATAYAPRPDGSFGVAMSDFEQVGDGGVQTSIADLARWDANFYEPKVGGPELVAKLRTPGKLDDGTPLTYALGLMETTEAGLAREEHSGGWAGYRANIERYPSERLTVAALCNHADAEPDELTHAVAATFLPQLANAEPSPPAAAGAPEPAASKAKGLTAMPAKTIEAALGRYYDPSTFETRAVEKEGDGVNLRIGLEPDAPRRPLEAADAKTFGVQGTPTRYVFDAAAKSLTRQVTGQKTQTFVRMEPITVDAKALGELAGRYTSDEFVHDLQVVVEKGALRVGPWGRTPASPPLTPLVRDVFTGGGVGIKFERDAKGHVRGLTMSAARMVGLAFQRR